MKPLNLGMDLLKPAGTKGELGEKQSEMGPHHGSPAEPRGHDAGWELLVDWDHSGMVEQPGAVGGTGREAGR